MLSSSRAGPECDWPCETEYLLREENLGCREAPAQAITWFFEHVEEGIILEDDCLPLPDFEEFKRSGQISSLLSRYPYMQWRFTRIFQKYHQRAPWFSDVWDWMWFYAILKNGGLCVLPNYNMIPNIGSMQATHTMHSETDARKFEVLPDTLKHPPRKSVNEFNDQRIFRLIYNGDWKDSVRYGLSRFTFKDWM